jgi:hypothetical protein
MSTADTAQSYTHTLRITFAYDGSNLQISRVQRVAMRAPASQSAQHENQAGYWLEVRDDKGNLLYWRPIHDPMRQDIESYGDAPGAPLRRQPASAMKGEFEVLVPDLPAAHTFRLHGPSAGTRAMLARSGPLREHSFEELRSLAARESDQGGAR